MPPSDEVEAARARWLAALGTVDDARLAAPMPVVPWPAGNGRWAIVRDGATTFIASDGLSDPEDERLGFGVEVVMATNEPIGDVRGSWLFQAIAETSNVIADYAFGDDVRPLVEELGSLSLSLESLRGVPDEYIAPDGTVGVLLGVRSNAIADELAIGAQKIRVLVARLLKANELADVLDEGDPARERIVRALEELPAPHLEALDRKSTSTGVKAPPPPLLDERRAELEPVQGAPSALLLIQGIGRYVSEEDLREVFSTIGEVKALKLGMLNRVEMASAELGAKAVEALHGRFVRGQPISLSYMHRR